MGGGDRERKSEASNVTHPETTTLNIGILISVPFNIKNIVSLVMLMFRRNLLPPFSGYIIQEAKYYSVHNTECHISDDHNLISFKTYFKILNCNKTGKLRINVTLGSVRVTIFAVEMQ